jgi:hypothetical protein
MNEIPVVARPEGDEVTSSCSCCGRPVHRGAGELVTTDGAIADCWYQWPEGHEGRFSIAVCPRDDDGEPVAGRGVVVVSGRVAAGGIQYSVLEPGDAPWSDFGAYGPVLTRKDALEGPFSRDLFNYIDAIAANEKRLSSRILPFTHGA